MLLTGLCFVAVTAIVKHVGAEMPPAEAAFLRYALGLVFLLPILGALRREGFGGRRGVGLFAVRGGVHALGTILWFYAMTQIPIAEVTALNYLSPVYITLGAALFLGEPLAARRLAAIGAALVGVLLILRPGVREVSSGHLAMLATAIFFAISYLIAKRMTRTSSPPMVVAMLSVGVTLGLAPFAAAVWVPPSLAQIGWLFLTAAVATVAHLAMTFAFRAAPVAVTQPMTFLQLVWAALLGWAVFGEALDPWVLSGGTIIVASVCFIAWRESVAGRRRAAGISPAGRPVSPERPVP
ncbi:DMT family transporter [Rhodobacteraceae bacterium MCCB 386]|nr:DMT family transporter [Roseitranquillus sediminis]